MSEIRALLLEVEQHGAKIIQSGRDRLTLRRAALVPDDLSAQVKAAKWAILRFLSGVGEPELAPTTAQEFRNHFVLWPWNLHWDLPHPARRYLKPESHGGGFWHWCSDCGRWAVHGFGVDLQHGQLGEWRCGLHRTDGKR
ncbi:hypothetical protein [Candidatus Magnetaquicoccus inordinatus]|uniref:hypothetical protein n=1 Tax=Candidatus Magnetaquicoccus inordinatus TaxID=2496818 RepID=UPI00102C50E2|nr:hypothetical protein [Candidatus Magnetaquicoccus inordinatus]